MINAYYGWLSLLAVATVMNACFIAWALHRRFRGKASAASGSAQLNGRLSLRRLPHAILTWSRIVGFRLRIPRVEMNLIEFALSIMYLAGCLAFTFAPSKSCTSIRL